MFNLQGVFFNWSALKMTKCQITCKSLQKSSKCQNFLRVWHLVIFRADQLKKPPCICIYRIATSHASCAFLWRVWDGLCISGSSLIDHLSETVEKKSRIHLIPSCRASHQKSRPQVAGRPSPAPWACTLLQPHQACPCGHCPRRSRLYGQLLASCKLWRGCWLWRPWPRPSGQSR